MSLEPISLVVITSKIHLTWCRITVGYLGSLRQVRNTFIDAVQACFLVLVVT